MRWGFDELARSFVTTVVPSQWFYTHRWVNSVTWPVAPLRFPIASLPIDLPVPLGAQHADVHVSFMCLRLWHCAACECESNMDLWVRSEPPETAILTSCYCERVSVQRGLSTQELWYSTSQSHFRKCSNQCEETLIWPSWLHPVFFSRFHLPSLHFPSCPSHH